MQLFYTKTCKPKHTDAHTQCMLSLLWCHCSLSLSFCTHSVRFCSSHLYFSCFMEMHHSITGRLVCSPINTAVSPFQLFPNIGLMVKVSRGDQTQQGNLPPWSEIWLSVFLRDFSLFPLFSMEWSFSFGDSLGRLPGLSSSQWGQLVTSLTFPSFKDGKGSVCPPHPHPHPHPPHPPHLESWIWYWAKANAKSSASCHNFHTLSSTLPLSAKHLNTCLHPIDFLAIKHMLNILAELG